MKVCTKCKEEKGKEAFYHPRQSWCKECTLLFQRSEGRNRQLQKRYGISTKEYNVLFDLQEGKCAICKAHQSTLTCALAVDHSHSSKTVRGLLCYNCNMGLGRFKDLPSLLLEAYAYLMRCKNQQDTSRGFLR